MRITGLGSGMDIDSIVKQLVTAKKGPLDRLNQQKTTLEWQREQYRDVTSKLVDFRNNKLFTYGLQSGIAAKQVNISGNMTAVSAKAGSGAAAGAINIEVTNLATAAKVTSTADIAGGIDKSKTLSELQTAGKIAYTAVGGKVSFNLQNGSKPPVTVTVNETDKLSDVVAAINNSPAKVNAFIDSVTGRMSISSKETGAGSIALTDTSGLLANFSLPAISSAADQGKDASLVINGIATTRSSNVFTENGVEITLNAPSAGTPTTLNIVTNTDTVMDTIKSFIKDFNDVLDTVTSKVNEARYRKYAPLTAEQKEGMKDSEITLWEDKAKSGLLNGDATLTKLMGDIRLSSISPITIDGKPLVLGEMGIDSSAWENRGKLVIKDESKLRAAIEADPDQVMKFFTQQTKESDPIKKVSATNPDNGLFNRLSNVIMSSLDELASRVGTSKYSADKNSSFLLDSTFGDRLRSLDDRINEESDHLNRLETSYYQKFTAMETAMNRYNSQGSSLFGASQ
ncbi:flagellar filament capping protein FliD [Paenibacillus sp. R14(2021)]|uniref:flagellar filament capping protein FliD n=1 Tax=Paenibacillus sp. R14(2021) TaxID=2859228 RepID=UPI001C61399D|nr:flagellar filament capping protein FliD [Paenibacillus sp. R14(2021)]